MMTTPALTRLPFPAVLLLLAAWHASDTAAQTTTTSISPLAFSPRQVERIASDRIQSHSIQTNLPNASLVAPAALAATSLLPSTVTPTVGLVSQRFSTPELGVFPERSPTAANEIELSRFKKQALQSVAISSGLMADISGDGLSSGFLDASIGSGIPLGSFENILGVTPRVRIDWIDAESDIDIPDELYQFEMQFFYRRAINERLSAIAIFSPSIRSDLTTDDRAFRVFALGLLNWEYIPDRLTLSAGAVFLGRADLPVLPAVGFTWTPNPTTRLDARFPVSQLSHRLQKNGGQSELWTYLSAGLGGNTWAVTRQSGVTDELSLRDFRLSAGLERLRNGGGGWFIETGYAFARQIEYERDRSTTELADGFLFQAGWRY